MSLGAAIADALDGWSRGPARVAGTLSWIAWGAGIVALFAPRPLALTTLRVLAPTALACAALAATATSAGIATLALANALVACVLVLSSPVAQACVNAAAYGDEVRFPLRIPAPLLLGPVPLAVAVVAAGIAAGPLLLGAGHDAAGAAVLVIGFASAAIVGRSLHSLSQRWIVLVPAGVVVVDPMTLLDPVLVRREHVAALRRLPGPGVAPAPDGADAAETLDLRLGTSVGSVALRVREPQPFARRRGRVDAQIVHPAQVLVATVRAREFIESAGARRLPAG